MALHRDIYWVGRQWAVTGYGIQACDQKQKAQFDIEAARIWEDGVLETMRAQKWLNIEDFSKAVSVARARYPEPPQKVAPLPKSVLDSVEAVASERDLKETSRQETGLKEASPKDVPIEEPKPAAQNFNMRIDGWPAKFVPQWRIRVRR
jgi:hypothetical protein